MPGGSQRTWAARTAAAASAVRLRCFSLTVLRTLSALGAIAPASFERLLRGSRPGAESGRRPEGTDGVDAPKENDQGRRQTQRGENGQEDEVRKPPPDRRAEERDQLVARCLDVVTACDRHKAPQDANPHFGGEGQAEDPKQGVRSHKERSEERRVGKECRSRWSPYH